MTTDWKVVRVFISSTFRDMQAERDHLVRFVFPELRERCTQLRLHLVDVDLRWGVTEDDAQRGRVIETCLDEIDRCRPFFVGILGARYGWVPPRYQVPDEPAYDWVRSLEPGHSVTALEIYHGVLRNPAMRPRAFFYFRDPRFLAGVPPDRRADFVAESPEAAARLERLKAAIRAQYPVWDGYPVTALAGEAGEQALLGGLEAFGQRVLADLWAAIEQQHGEAAPAAPSDPESAESVYHEAFLDRSARQFVGRADLLAELTEYAGGAATVPLVVTGEPGSGKSALLATFAMRYAHSRPDAVVLPHFIGVSPGSSDIRRTLRRLWRELARQGIDLGEIPEDYEELRRAFLRNLARPPGREVVLVLDGLNQLDARQRAHSLDWLPGALPPGLRIVLSTLEGDCLAALRGRIPRPRELAVGALALEERQQLVRQTLAQYRKRLDERPGHDQLGQLLAKQDAPNPLYLSVACEELRVFGTFEAIGARIERLPGDLDGLFGQVLERVETDHGRDLVARTFSLLDCSRHGLLESELLELLRRPGEPALPRALWAGLFRSLQFYLKPAGETGEGMLDFFHRQLARAARRRYLGAEEIRIGHHAELAAHFRATADPGGGATWQGTDPRGFSELTHHLAEAGDYGGLQELVRTGFLTVEAQRSGEGEALADLRRIAEALGRGGLAWREAMIEAARTYCRMAEEIRSTRRRFERLIEVGAVDRVELLLDGEPDQGRRGGATLAAAVLLEAAGYDQAGARLWSKGQDLLPVRNPPPKGLGKLDPGTLALLGALAARRTGSVPRSSLDRPSRSERSGPRRFPGELRPLRQVPLRGLVTFQVFGPLLLWWGLFAPIVLAPASLSLYLAGRVLPPLLPVGWGTLALIAFGILIGQLGVAVLLFVTVHRKLQHGRAPADWLVQLVERLAEGVKQAPDPRAKLRILTRLIRFRAPFEYSPSVLAQALDDTWNNLGSGKAHDRALVVALASSAGDTGREAMSGLLRRASAAEREAVFGELATLSPLAVPRVSGQLIRLLAEHPGKQWIAEALATEVRNLPDLVAYSESGGGRGRHYVYPRGIEQLIQSPDLARAVLTILERPVPPKPRRFLGQIAAAFRWGFQDPLSPVEPVWQVLLLLPVLVWLPPAVLLALAVALPVWLLRETWAWEYDPYLLRLAPAGGGDSEAVAREVERILARFGSGLSRSATRRVRRALIAQQIAVEGTVQTGVHGRRLVASVLAALARRGRLGRPEQLLLNLMGDRTLLELSIQQLSRRSWFRRRARPATATDALGQLQRTLPVRPAAVQFAAAFMLTAGLFGAGMALALKWAGDRELLAGLRTPLAAGIGLAGLLVLLRHVPPGIRQVAKPRGWGWFRSLALAWREPDGQPEQHREAAQEARVASGAIKYIVLCAGVLLVMFGLGLDGVMLGERFSRGARVALRVFVAVALLGYLVVPEATAAWRGSGLLFPGRIRLWVQRLLLVPVLLAMIWGTALLLRW